MAASEAPPRAQTAGYPRIHLAQVDSTNTELARRYQQDPTLAAFTTVTADHQHQGRGRYGRTWVDTAGSLLASVLVRVPAANVSWLTAVAGLAAARAVAATYARLGEAVQLKWPNDVMVAGKKVGGILTEHLAGTDREENTVIVGIGLNFGAVSPDAGEAAGALPVDVDAVEIHTAREEKTWAGGVTTKVSPPVESLREDVLARFLIQLQSLLGQSRETWLGEYRARLFGRASHLQFTLPDGEVIRGRIIDIDADAHLLVETEDGMRALSVAVVEAPALENESPAQPDHPAHPETR